MTQAAPPLAGPRGAALAFSLFGFPIRARAEFFLIFAIFGSGSGDVAHVVGWVAVCFVSILFHELGHALIGRAFGLVSSIELHGMGGVTHLSRRDATAPALSWFADLLISLAGPLFGLLLGTLVWILARAIPGVALSELGRWLVPQLLWVNIGWSVVNLAPILPYDGGQALRALLRRLFPASGVRLSHWITVVLGAFVIILAVAFRNRWSGGFWIGYLALRGVVLSWSALRRARVDEVLSRGWGAWDALDFSGARAAAMQAVSLAQEPVASAAGVELVVLSCLALTDEQGAKSAFDAYPAGVQPSVLLRAVVALDREDESAIPLLKQVPEPVVARVLLPLFATWARSTWEERLMAWLDPKAVDALPRQFTEELGAKLFHDGAYRLTRQILESRFASTRSAQDAYNVGCACAKMGDVSVALEWLERAVDAGWDDGEAMDADEDLTAPRALPGYSALRARVSARPV